MILMATPNEDGHCEIGFHFVFISSYCSFTVERIDDQNMVITLTVDDRQRGMKERSEAGCFTWLRFGV